MAILSFQVEPRSSIWKRHHRTAELSFERPTICRGLHLVTRFATSSYTCMCTWFDHETPAVLGIPDIGAHGFRDFKISPWGELPCYPSNKPEALLSSGYAGVVWKVFSWCSTLDQGGCGRTASCAGLLGALMHTSAVATTHRRAGEHSLRWVGSFASVWSQAGVESDGK